MTDDTQVVTDDYAFDAWGNQISSTGSTANSQLWKGQFLAYRKDPNAGPEVQYAMHHRNYDPKTGVFTSADPAKDDLNLYRYVKNNPVNSDDPSGLEDFEPQGPLTPPHQRKLGERYLARDPATGRIIEQTHLIEPDDVPVLVKILEKLNLSDFEFSGDQLVRAGKLLDQIRYFRSTFKSDIAIKLEWELEGDLKRWSREQSFLERERTVALGKLNQIDPRVQRIADWAKQTGESEKRAIEAIHQSGAGPTSTFLQTMLQRALTIVERGLQTATAVGTAPDVVLEGAIEQIDNAGTISRDAHEQSGIAGIVLFVAELSNFARYADSVEGRTLNGQTLTEEERNAAETEGLVGGVLLAGDFLTLFAAGGPLSSLAGSSRGRIGKLLDQFPQSRRGSVGIPDETPKPTGGMKSAKKPKPDAPDPTPLTVADDIVTPKKIVVNIGGAGEFPRGNGTFQINVDEAVLKRMGPDAGALVKADMRKLPFGDGTVDLIQGSRTPFDLQFGKEVAEEAFRVLKPGGKFVWSARSGGEALAEAMRKAGFKDVRMLGGHGGAIFYEGIR